MVHHDFIINYNDPILITGANGFIGYRVVETLLRYGFKKLRCFVRPSSNLTTLNKIIESSNNSKIRVIKGNLLARDNCKKATSNISVIYHLAAGMEKMIDGVNKNSIIATKNMLEEAVKIKTLKRFTLVSSFTVYSNKKSKKGVILDEKCEVEDKPQLRGEAYCYGKVKQEELLNEYHTKYKLPYVIVRPGVVYGPGKKDITGRVGIRRFGIFLNLGGSNRIPFTYVDNCADAIVLAGLKKEVEGEVFNIVDDDLPTSKQFLKMYKKNVENLKSIYVPKIGSYFLCYLWEKYSKYSEEQLAPALNRKRWSADWKGNRYSNEKIKRVLGWKPKVSLYDGLERYFEYCKKGDLND